MAAHGIDIFTPFWAEQFFRDAANQDSKSHMKTAHQFARELLAGPDHPIFHFDPSCAGFNHDDDTSISAPIVEVVDDQRDEDGKPYPPFLTIVGKQHEEHELEEGT